MNQAKTDDLITAALDAAISAVKAAKQTARKKPNE